MLPTFDTRSMGRLARTTAAGAALLLLGLTTASASSSKFFQASTQADFLKGDLENLSLDSQGRMSLGPAVELIYETSSPFLWSILPSTDDSLILGAGNDGRVFRVDRQGRGSQLFDASELEAHALAPAPNGGVYVGTSPRGKIYKIDRAGAVTTFFDPGAAYIWALAVDASGNLFAATGDKGIVYKITPDGKGEPFYRTKATHATALAFDRAGNLLIGTESPGRVFRVDTSGKGFILLDSPFQEVRSLRFDAKGDLYVAALNGRAAGSLPAAAPATDAITTGSPGVPTVSVSTEISAVAVVDTSGATASAASGANGRDARGPRGAVYRIGSDGLWDRIWESREDSPYDVVFDAEGRLLIGTGNKGKIFRLEGNPLQATLVARAAAQQVTALYRDGQGRLYYATANPGKLYRLSPKLAPRGTYESEPRDAQMAATWGSLRWRATSPSGGRVDIATRSGNTETPDDTWSPWSAPYATADGSPITSPKARYLQWRVTLSGQNDSPILTSLSAAYLPRNLRPQVRSITVHPPGIVFQKPFSTGDPELAGFENQTTPDRRLAAAAASNQSAGSTPALGRRTYQKGLQTLQWRADDENDDELSFTIEYRREGESTWKTLKRDIAESLVVWDTTTVPNGTYFVRVLASDRPSNATDSALTGELSSTAFDVDNTPPRIGVVTTRQTGSQTIAEFEVRDDDSAIQKVEYSVNGIDWLPVFPTDGVSDSKVERYELRLDGPLGPKGLSLRASDAMNNVSSSQTEVPTRR